MTLCNFYELVAAPAQQHATNDDVFTALFHFKFRVGLLAINYECRLVFVLSYQYQYQFQYLISISGSKWQTHLISGWLF